MNCNYLIVHKISYKYISRIVDYIYEQLNKHSLLNVEFILCDDINDVNLEFNSTVYIIGDLFDNFNKTKNCKYVFLNFSVLYVIGNPMNCSFNAYRKIRKKKKIFESKIKCFDFILDFWPLQTFFLQNEFSIPVKSFPVGVNLDNLNINEKTTDRKYDLCFVGSMTNRREKLLKKIESLGLEITPYKNVIFEEKAMESKIVLNVHAHRSNHIEMPRIIGALACKSALVTEFNSNLSKLVVSDCYISNTYNKLIPQIEFLLVNPDEINTLATNGFNWINNNYLIKCEIEWKKIIEDIYFHFYEFNSLLDPIYLKK